MGERTLESFTTPDNRLIFRFEGYTLEGFSLRFVSGPERTKNIMVGAWLDAWDTLDGKRRFSFGPTRALVFTTQDAAKDAQSELKNAVDIITEVTE